MTRTNKRPPPTILGYIGVLVSSCTYNSDAYSSTFDAGSDVALNDNFVEILSWHDNRYGCSNRVVECKAYMASKEQEALNYAPQQVQETTERPLAAEMSLRSWSPNSASNTEHPSSQFPSQTSRRRRGNEGTLLS